MALRITGQAQAAALQIGRTPGAVYARRRRNPGFARDWDETIAAQQAQWIAARQARLAESGNALDSCEGGPPAPWREASNGFGQQKRALFLRVLARTKNVGEACRAAGVASSTVYALRARSVRFANGWEKALLKTPPPSVIGAALARAVEGWEEPVFYGGKLVGHRRRFSEGLLRDLMRAERARAAEAAEPAGRAPAGRWRGGPAPRYATREETDAKLMKKLDVIEAQMREEERREQAEDWDRWRLSWVDPAAARRDEDEDGDGDEVDDSNKPLI